MPTVRFNGRTFPASVHVSIQMPTIHWEDAPTGLIMDFDAHAKDGTITIECRTNKYDHALHLIPIYNRAFDIARAGIDLVSFSTGRPFTVILETVVEPTGQERPFGHFEPDLGSLVGSLKSEKDFHHILSIVILEWPLYIALRDLIEAITIPHRVAINCARVVETIRSQMINDPKLDRAQGWALLRDNLNVSREYVEFITTTSKGPRHGYYWSIIGSDLKESATRTWKIMDRFLEFRKRGNKKLPLDDFPLLAG